MMWSMMRQHNRGSGDVILVVLSWQLVGDAVGAVLVGDVVAVLVVVGAGAGVVGGAGVFGGVGVVGGAGDHNDNPWSTAVMKIVLKAWIFSTTLMMSTSTRTLTWRFRVITTTSITNGRNPKRIETICGLILTLPVMLECGDIVLAIARR